MQPGPDDLRRLAEQAGLDLDDEDLAVLHDQLAAVLAWADELPAGTVTPMPAPPRPQDPLP